MRTTIAIPLVVLLSSPAALAQNPPIDLNLWTVEDLNGAGPWFTDPPRQFAYSTNTVNTDCSVLYSDFQVAYLEFRMSIDPSGGDDDLSGFVLGWNPGDSSNPTANYLLVDWKRITQTYQDWGTAPAGLALSHVNGQFTPGYGGGPIDLWSHTGNCTELMRSTTYGQTGWEFATPYHFVVAYAAGNPGSVDIWVNGQLELQATGVFASGRFGCYNYSQPQTEFQFRIMGSFGAFGSACSGSVGAPYLFAPEEPLVGEDLPILIGSIPPAALSVLAIGFSNSTLSGVPLPIDLQLLGAPGCSIYTSSDLFIPVTNYNGTAYTNLRIPSTEQPSTVPVLYAQGMATDPAANSLGLVLSNAAALSIGIR